MTFHVSTALWLTRTRISAQFIAVFFSLPSNIPSWKECKNPCFTDDEVKQRQMLCSSSYTGYLNQNQTHALFPKVTFPASLRLLYNPIIGGRAMCTQLPAWIAPLKMWVLSDRHALFWPRHLWGFAEGQSGDSYHRNWKNSPRGDWGLG